MAGQQVQVMSIGNSGRIVIEIEPELKKELHSVLRNDGTNLKAWFLENVDQLLSAKGQRTLPFEENSRKTEVKK